ncbi:type II CAAX endopeptidase family protein [Carboxydochorda subterranea]|uniref:Type II CAAX endopeptidase family protein n=1 Tax=Carboxydichorda subterranea TaxID=3109565 RepID=A0ABZ1C3V8_9FIRM|nr:type II CAAX endopeptidase family protein [Limnochorda sp. L945t]WRP18718.1 type II CAAX endopeptidase family protein [Limnochorda sp. L945t]
MRQQERPISLPLLYLTTANFGVLGLVILWMSHSGDHGWWTRFVARPDPWQVLGWGTALALAVVMFEIAVATLLPDRLWADDGTNAYLSNLSHLHIFLLMALTAVAEELFFRAAIQSLLVDWLSSALLGIPIAAVIFAATHVRYLKQPVLLGGAWAIGLALGLGYWLTGSLWTSVWAHFLINFVMSVFGKKGWFLPRREPQVSGRED